MSEHFVFRSHFPFFLFGPRFPLERNIVFGLNVIANRRCQSSHTLDLFDLMPYHSESKETREEIWDDGLHFTPYGYNVMGDYIAQCLVKLLPIVEKEVNVKTAQAEEEK